MEVLDEGPWTRPELDPGPLDRPYFEAAGDGRLIIQRCPQCDHRQFPPKMFCTRCGGSPEWFEVSGLGEVYTFTVLRRHGVPPFVDMVPFVLAMVDLPEGARLMGNVIGADLETFAVGRPVEAYAIRVDESLALPTWRMRDDG
ncbi:MAG: Zn-ribbon domain-containing OB-fold protein [Acidimicrobiales bacterium]